MLVQQQKLEEAKPYLQEAVYLSDKPDSTLFGLFGLAEVNTGNFVAAEYHYKKAFELNPDVQDWGIGLSKALMSQEKYEQANVVMKSMLDRMADKKSSNKEAK